MLVRFIEQYNLLLLLLFMACYFYQAVYVAVGLLKKDKETPENPELRRYAVLISARNESTVIGELLDSIRAQNYPAELIDIYVVADNCTDHTADAARAHGACVFERFNNRKVGKGYALDFAFSRIRQEKGLRYYAGYFVFDADNVLDPDYVREMNRTFSLGYPVLTSYRNSKNYDSNWISASYALWFIRESRFLNGARMKCGTSCAISGTGFLVSWNQRMRWTKGFYQVFAHYGKGLVDGIFRRRSFQCYDMLMTIAPATLITLASLLLNGFFAIFGIVTGRPLIMDAAVLVMGGCLINVYLSLLAFGVVTLITERRRIHCKTGKCIRYLFAFPVFIFTYIPMAVVALFKDVTWKPVPHTVIRSADQICRHPKKQRI